MKKYKFLLTNLLDETRCFYFRIGEHKMYFFLYNNYFYITFHDSNFKNTVQVQGNGKIKKLIA